MKHVHSDMVKAGKERARHNGKHIRRPRVTDRPDFNQRFWLMRERLNRGAVSRRRAAKELEICYTTLERLLDRPPMSHALFDSNTSIKALAEVLY
jgi:hypothetical protein